MAWWVCTLGIDMCVPKWKEIRGGRVLVFLGGVLGLLGLGGVSVPPACHSIAKPPGRIEHLKAAVRLVKACWFFFPSKSLSPQTPGSLGNADRSPGIARL
jgi:hypothetical protein